MSYLDDLQFLDKVMYLFSGFMVVFAGQEQKTDVREDELNPTWNKEFQYDLNGQTLSPQETLQIKVKDYEKIAPNRLLGSVTVPLKNLVRSKNNSLKIEVGLLDGEQRPTLGKVQLSLTYEPPPSAVKKSARGEAEDEEELLDEEIEDEGGDLGKKRTKRKKRQKKHKALSNKPQDFQIRVKVFEGRQLTGGNIHPVVRVSVADQDKESKIKKCTNNPAFNENFSFNFHEAPMDLFEKMVSFEVFNSKKYRSDALIGYFELDIFSIYEMPGHAFIRKWMLLSDPGDKEAEDEEAGKEKRAKGVRGNSKGGSPAGYLKATVIILGPGDKPPDLSKLAGEDDTDDIEANLLRPAGVGLQDGVFTLKVYRAEDLPQMDTALMQGVKKFFNMQKDDEKLVDPYVLFQFCGKENRTSTKYKTDCPEFKEILRVPFKFPSMCQRVKFQIFDWDRLTDDDCIATSFLTLQSISGQGDEGFLPTYGPCWLNFFGSPREFSELPDEYDDLNMGKGEGVAYRGRLLVELQSKLGEEIDKELEEIRPDELIRVQPYLSRSKYKLFACFYEATMVSDVDGPIEFEVSIGNCGNMMDESVAPSNTPPCNAVYDGSNYYYLPWSGEKPCVCVESYWEDIAFRLEPLNALLRIIDRLEIKIAEIEHMITAKEPKVERASALFSLLDQLIADCSNGVPTLKGKANKLDEKRRRERKYELSSIVREASELKEKATNVEAALSEVNGYLQRLQDIAEEPQNSLPDVIIWMVSGSTRIAYHRIPAYEVMFSPREDACGKHCGKTIEIEMKYPGKKALEIGDHPELPAMVRVELWFGLEKHQNDWTAREKSEGDFAVLAETYENEMKLGFWTKTALPRPDFSNSSGELPLAKESFQAPEGWEFHGDWYIAPEMSLMFDRDSGHKTFLEDAFENEARMIPGGNWRPASSPWANVQGDKIDDKDKISCPEGWEWTGNWQVDNNRAVDDEGWEYAVDVSFGVFGAIQRAYHLVRRRRWVRERLLKNPKMIIKQKELEEFEKEGWEYAPIFTAKFHHKERKIDLVRRRRWHRKMVAKGEKGTKVSMPPVCLLEIDGEENRKSCLQSIPRMFVTYEKPHKYQLWAYIYQARDLLAMDESGMNDAYARVVFGKQSAVTEVLTQSLCPTWDQTLIFDEIEIHECVENVAKNPPSVVVELFDRDSVGKDGFLGRCIMSPLVRLKGHQLPEPPLQWFKITRGQEDAGELLAACELFLDEGAELPFTPPTRGELFAVRSGVRPKLQRSAIEVLCWGVRNMKKFQLSSVTTPSIEFECAGVVVQSEVIKDTKKNPNFEKPVLTRMIVNLPMEEIYMPALNIRVRDNRTFGRRPIVGVHSMRTVQKYRCETPRAIEDVDALPQKGDLASFPSKHGSHIVDIKDPAVKKQKRKKKGEVKDEYFDWWSKFYASIGDREKCGEYLTNGYSTMEVYQTELEKVEGFSGFEDFINLFPLYRGKAKSREEEEDAVVGEFKGTFRVYPMPKDEQAWPLPETIFTNLPPNQPLECLVRLYVIKALNLQPRDDSGTADPYLRVTLGKQKFDDEDNYKPYTLNPVFGRLFEMTAVIPIVKDLKIAVVDHDIIGRDDVIGETTIDLEQRVLSRFHATVGCAKFYSKAGPDKWRDIRKPRTILKDWCLMHNKPLPEYNDESCSVMLDGTVYTLSQFEDGAPIHRYSGKPQSRLALHVLNQLNLVPDHVETRSLYNKTTQPTTEQGKLQLWVDIFPLSDGTPPDAVDVKPRLPVDFVLRVIIWNTKDVIMQETSITGEKMSDIYVKGWIDGIDESQETDVHYRSMDGEGNFNWRFVFPFNYIPSEKKLVVSEKKNFWSLDETIDKLTPRLVIQIWDNDLGFASDDFLGTLQLDLTALIKPATNARSCKIPDATNPAPTLDLFKQKRCYGWWSTSSLQTGTLRDTGKIEMTIEAIPKTEADIKPAGRGRDEPNKNPTLEEPNRPPTSFPWFTSPLKAIRHIIWGRFKWYIIGFLILLIILSLIAYFIYSVPGYTIKKILRT
ncbi:myoferlin-like isoform X1 [Acropora muricata]|uniref:myoferlin-like isoform X1 n=1 Tax=Acropora muricata TaxID=159855 RepID=UPI0034E52CEB